MNVVFFLKDLRSGGVQKRTLRLISGLIEDKYRITLIINENTGAYFDIIPSGVDLVVLESKYPKSNVVWGLQKALSFVNPDVVITCMGQEFIKAFLAQTISKTDFKLLIIQAVPAKLPGESPIKNIIRKIGIGIFYNFADQIICVSKDVKKSLSSVRKSLEKKAQVIHNPVVKKNIHEVSAQDVHHPFFNGGAKVLVSVGRLHLQKDYPTLVEAFKISQNLTSLPLKLIILGEGEERSSLERLIAEHNLGGDIDLVGYKDNPFPYLRKADLFVMSSLWEGLPSVLIESLAVGTPAVSTDCKAGPREILKDGEYGTLVPVSNISELANGILKELKKDRNSQELMDRGKKYSVQNSVIEYKKLLKNIV